MKALQDTRSTIKLVKGQARHSRDAPANREVLAEIGSAIPELKRVADWMDSAFRIPGLNVKFGFDAILGLVPGFGDTAASVVSLYILHAANRRGVSRLTMTRMALNLAIDYLIGAIPVVGDLFDVYWKANQKNVELLRRHAIANPMAVRRLQGSDWMFFAGLASVLIAVLVGSLTIAYFAFGWLGSVLFPSMS